MKKRGIDSRKGQITVFIILGLVLVLLISLFIYYYSTTRQIETEQAEVAYFDSQAAKILVQSCLEQTSQEALERLGNQGGYLFLPQGALLQLTQTDKFTFLYHNRVELIPTLGDMEDELEDYINSNMRYCFDDMANFKSQNFEITIKDPKTKVDITSDNIQIRLNYPLIFKKGNVQFSLDNFATILPIKLRKVYKGLSQVIEEAKATEEQIEEDIEKIKDSFGTKTFKPEKYIPPKEFVRDGLKYKTYWYQETPIVLYMISDQDFDFKFAVKLYISEG